jgi:UDP-glucose 4-epimerase
MTILITGGAGYIGAQTVYAFLDAGHKDIVVVDNLVSGFQSNLPKEAKFYNGNLRDDTVMAKIFSENIFDTVVHIAGSTVVSESVENPLKYYLNNTDNTRILLDYCVKHSVKNFIFSSTAAVYGSNPLQLMKEEYAPAPETPYASSKLMAEKMIEDTSAAHGLKYVILRYFNVSGADPKGRTGQNTKNATHLIKVICEAAAGRRDNVKVYGTDYTTKDGSGVRDFVHVADVGNAHVRVADYLNAGKPNRIFNVGYGSGYSVLETIAMVEKITGCKLKIDLEPRRAGDIGALTADSTLLQTETGWKPEHADLEEIISSALAWEKSLS